MIKNTKVHFMGICGSGAAPIAIIAKDMGFEVSGCDLNVSGYYMDILKENNVDVMQGHSSEHLESIDILAISPAVLDISPNHPEIVEAKKRNILMTWQEFSGKYIQNEKKIIAISGTHGKSTTTILMGLVLEDAGLDPIVEAGTTFKRWGGGCRLGKSNYFVCEADEFNNNFHNYNSSIAIINNVEMDHPEFFKDIEDVKESFKGFIKKLKGSKVLIINEESKSLTEIIDELRDWLKQEKVKLIGYYVNNKFNFPFTKEYKAQINTITPQYTTYSVINDSNQITDFKLGLGGKHNVENSLGVLIAALELGVNINDIKRSFENFNGIGRRFELIGDIGDIKVFDDFAHHPTAIASTIDAIKASYPKKRVYAIFEPHQLSRLKLFYNEFIDSLKNADRVIITKPYLGREADKNIEPVNLKTLANEINVSTAEYIEDNNIICDKVVNEAKKGDIVLVFGAGESYKLSQKIIEGLKSKRMCE